jgi:predicted DNA-binding transcriptional regulator YafY
MNRFDRITAILIQLQSRKIVKAQDLADRFEISLRTVYRDMNTLAEAGVPIIGEAGIGYSIMEGYRLPPVMFTKEEARTFITAEKLMEKFTDPSTKSHYQSAMFKVKSVLKSAEKNLVEDMEQHIEIRQKYSLFNPTLSNTLETILKSVAEKKVAKIKYSAFASEEQTNRLIEPVGIFHENNFWYVVAYCLLRSSYRNFRTDRIDHIELTDTIFSQKHASLKEYLDHTPRYENLEKVIIRVEKQILPYIQNQKYYYGFISERKLGDKFELTFLTASLDGFSRWYMMFAEYAEIVQPASLVDLLKKQICTLSKHLENS